MCGLAAQEAETKVQGGEICQCHALPATPPGLAVITFISSYLNFELYKLQIKNVFVLNTYGDPKFPSVSTYLSVKL